jgi:hypothetical protein
MTIWRLIKTSAHLSSESRQVRHSRASGNPSDCQWIPAFAGTTTLIFIFSGGLAQTLPLNVCDAPKAQFGQIVPYGLTCPFGTPQTPHIGVCATRESHGWR